MASTWGSLSWSTGDFGDQANATATPTGVVLTSEVATPSVVATVDFGWSNNAWGEVAWNTNEVDVIGFPTGIQLNATLNNLGISGEINEGWGRITWGENAWGIAGDVAVTGIGLTAGINVGEVIIDVENAVAGQELELSLNSITLDIGAAPGVAGEDLTLQVASVDTTIDAPVSVTGIELTSAAGILDGYNEIGWGRDGWGEEAYGGSGQWAFVEATGIELNSNLGTADADPVSFIEVTGQQQNLSIGNETISAGASADATGQQINIQSGSLDATGDASIELTGIEITIEEGDAEGKPVTIAIAQGQSLITVQGTTGAGASADVFPAGIGLEITLGEEVSQVWKPVDTGTAVAYTEVDTAA